jgi:hypothetical protein
MNENKSPDFIMESEICKFMMNPLIRSQVCSHLSNWMFTINATKAISECLLGNMFEGKEIEINHLILHIKQNFKSTKLSKEDYSTIFEILEGYKAETQIKEENFDFIVHTISEFIKSRLLVKGVEFFARGDQEKAYEYFETGVNFSISKSPFIDPSDENLILKLKELSMPRGGILMKSSISLINNTLTHKGYKYGDLVMCFTGETEIQTELGIKTLEELNKNNVNNFKVFSYNESTRKLEISLAKEVRFMKMADEILELEFDDGYKVKCTPDHKFLTKNRGWIEAQNLNEEDELEHLRGNQLGAVKRWNNKEYREKISKSMKGKKHSLEIKNRISNSMKGNKNNKKIKLGN